MFGREFPCASDGAGSHGGAFSPAGQFGSPGGASACDDSDCCKDDNDDDDRYLRAKGVSEWGVEKVIEDVPKLEE